MNKKIKHNRKENIGNKRLKKDKKENKSYKYDYEKLMNIHKMLKSNDPCKQLHLDIKKNDKTIDVIGVVDKNKSIGFMCAKPKDDNNFKFLGLIKEDNTLLTIDDKYYDKLKNNYKK